MMLGAERTIEADLMSVREGTLPREDFLHRLLERFVHVPIAQESSRDRFNILLLTGQGEEGKALPIFTSPDLFEKTPLAQNHGTVKLPFDALMRQIRPDTGLAINPFTDCSYSAKCFVLQGCIPDFGADIVRQEVTPEWLEKLNTEFNMSETPHGRRADEAIRRWSLLNDIPISISSLRARKVYDWFRTNIKLGSDWVGPLAEAAFYHGGAFWEITIPLCFGSPTINPLDMLHMPASVKQAFCRERNDVFIFVKFFADLYDYYYTVEDVRGTFRATPLLGDLVAAGREHLAQAAMLLLETRPNPKAAEVARTALEIFFKIFLVHRENVSERELKLLRHDLHKLLNRCIENNPTSELKRLESKLDLYPDISTRYRVDHFELRDLWLMYFGALTAGVIAMRPMSDRDSVSAIVIPEF